MTLLYTSIAARLDAGTYSPGVARAARMPIAAPTRHASASSASPWPAVLPYVGSALLGALLALCYTVSP
jgi:hypothetical protein